MEEKPAERFVVKEHSASRWDYEPRVPYRIVVDTVTGVNYLQSVSNLPGQPPSGFTPLLDRDGKPIVD